MNQNESLIEDVSHCFEPNHRTDINDRKNERIIFNNYGTAKVEQGTADSTARL